MCAFHVADHPPLPGASALQQTLYPTHNYRWSKADIPFTVRCGSFLTDPPLFLKYCSVTSPAPSRCNTPPSPTHSSVGDKRVFWESGALTFPALRRLLAGSSSPTLATPAFPNPRFFTATQLFPASIRVPPTDSCVCYPI